jgi:dCMP deaminase
MNTSERQRPSWDEYGMLLAYAAAQRSPDPYVQVGAAAFRRDRSTLATGYNGPLSGVEIDFSCREARRPHMIHAEHNCLKLCNISEDEGPYYLYVTMLPCAQCLNMACAYGVKEIIYDQVYERDMSSLSKAAEYKISLKQLTLKNNPFRYEHPKL